MKDIDAQIETAKQEMVDASTTRDAAQSERMHCKVVSEYQYRSLS